MGPMPTKTDPASHESLVHLAQVHLAQVHLAQQIRQGLPEIEPLNGKARTSQAAGIVVPSMSLAALARALAGQECHDRLNRRG